jgi:hypothetical protein
MKIVTITAIIALPLLALGQTTYQQQPDTQGQKEETQTTAPTKGKKMRPEQAQPGKEQAKPETNVRGQPQTNVKGRAQEPTKNEPGVNRTETGKTETGKTESGMRSGTMNETNVKGTSQTNVGTSQTTTVNKQEFRSRHSEVFSLGRHPKEFFVQRFGANHFRLIGNTYFVFVDGCWVAVDVDGFVYTQRMICMGDPDFIAVE